MKYSFILGGTSGLGLELAWESYGNFILPLICGRSVLDKEVKEKFPPNHFSHPRLDLANKEMVEEFYATFKFVLQSIDINYFFWVSGVFLRKPLGIATFEEIDQMIDVHLRGPIKIIKQFHLSQLKRSKPYHLVVIASTSSWRLRKDETIYCAVKAAKAAFARNFANELLKELPGSKVTLVNPGGLKTPNFWNESKQDISNFMEPKTIAKIIWDQILKQEKGFEEMQVLRKDDGSPDVRYGPMLPEFPK